MDTDIKCCSENIEKFIEKEEKPVIDKCNTVADLKEKYELKADSLILRLLTIKGALRSELGKDIDYDSILSVLDGETNKEDNSSTLESRLISFLPTKTNNDILEVYKIKTIGTR